MIPSNTQSWLRIIKKPIYFMQELSQEQKTYLIWFVKLMKMHMKLNLFSSICSGTGLNSVVLRKMTLLENIAGNSSFFNLILCATFETLPCPSNLKRWRLITESTCFLCRKSLSTSAHILGACKKALHQGRFLLQT